MVELSKMPVVEKYAAGSEYVDPASLHCSVRTLNCSVRTFILGLVATLLAIHPLPVLIHCQPRLCVPALAALHCTGT
jgi:hypothetical protein